MDSCVDRSTAISTRVRLFRLFLLIPCWESQRLIPKRSAGPRATKIGVVSLKALDHHRPNREESAILPLNYPPPGRTVARRSSLSKYPRTYESQQTVITATAGHVDPAAIAEEARTVRLDAVLGPPRRSVPVGDSSTPESRTLTPLIMVRIQVPQPGSRPQIAAYLEFPRSPE